MAHVCNLSPLPPSLDNGPVQRRVRRAFIATDKPVLSTSQIVKWTDPRPGTDRHHARRSVRRVCERYCERGGLIQRLGKAAQRQFTRRVFPNIDLHVPIAP
jgi:hypothetical protein